MAKTRTGEGRSSHLQHPWSLAFALIIREEGRGVHAAPRQDVNSLEERNWAVFCHVAALSGLIIPLGTILGPLLVWLLRRNVSTYVDQQGKEAVNFQISMAIYAVIAGVLVVFLIGLPLLLLVLILDIVFVIIAAIKVSEGKNYRYPITIRFLH